MKYKIWMRTDTNEHFCILAEGDDSTLYNIIGPRLADSLGCIFSWLEEINDH